MPILYLPVYMPELDYHLLKWLDNHGSKSEFGFKMMDEFDMNPTYLEKAFRRLNIQGLLLLTLQNNAIIEVALTAKAQRLLAEHILGELNEKSSS
jgi:hypothetical protein